MSKSHGKICPPFYFEHFLASLLSRSREKSCFQVVLCPGGRVYPLEVHPRDLVRPSQFSSSKFDIDSLYILSQVSVELHQPLRRLSSMHGTAAAFKLETHACTLGTLEQDLDTFEGPDAVEAGSTV